MIVYCLLMLTPSYLFSSIISSTMILWLTWTYLLLLWDFLLWFIVLVCSLHMPLGSTIILITVPNTFRVGLVFFSSSNDPNKSNDHSFIFNVLLICFVWLVISFSYYVWIFDSLFLFWTEKLTLILLFLFFFICCLSFFFQLIIFLPTSMPLVSIYSVVISIEKQYSTRVMIPISVFSSAELCIRNSVVMFSGSKILTIVIHVYIQQVLAVFPFWFLGCCSQTNPERELLHWKL